MLKKKTLSKTYLCGNHLHEILVIHEVLVGNLLVSLKWLDNSCMRLPAERKLVYPVAEVVVPRIHVPSKVSVTSKDGD